MKAKKTPRANKALAEARTEEIAHVVLDGAVWPLDLCELVRQKETEKESLWYVKRGEKPLSRSQIYRYALRAEKLIAESCRTSRKRLLRLHVAQRRRLYARAVNTADWGTALRIKDSEAKLLDLFPRPEDDLRLAVEDLKKQLTALEKHDGDSNPPGRHCPAETIDHGTAGADRSAGESAVG
jgi:hypothetical protein